MEKTQPNNKNSSTWGKKKKETLSDSDRNFVRSLNMQLSYHDTGYFKKVKTCIREFPTLKLSYHISENWPRWVKRRPTAHMADPSTLSCKK